LRLATLNDIPDIQELIVASVRTLSASYYTERQITSALLYIFGVDTQLIIDETYFVADEEGRIVGSGGWSKRSTLFGGDQFKGSEPDPLLDPKTDPARIRAFYIHPDWSRRGIGRQILAACEDAIRKAGFKRIELMATLPGEPLYSAMDYDRVRPEEMTMPDGESISGFLMAKNLTEPT
ncbi:MAG TPA: GNAT family N-acetyltransferase, partial [Pyrinomonadaceae bacterium]